MFSGLSAAEVPVREGRGRERKKILGIGDAARQAGGLLAHGQPAFSSPR